MSRVARCHTIYLILELLLVGWAGRCVVVFVLDNKLWKNYIWKYTLKRETGPRQKPASDHQQVYIKPVEIPRPLSQSHKESWQMSDNLGLIIYPLTHNYFSEGAREVTVAGDNISPFSTWGIVVPRPIFFPARAKQIDGQVWPSQRGWAKTPAQLTGL
jgi:hypothetical protein